MQTAAYIFQHQGKSRNAYEAESKGRWPLTHAIPIVARASGCTQKHARRILLNMRPCEWHHTGKYARRTSYYDTEAAIRLAALPPAELPLELRLAWA